MSSFKYVPGLTVTVGNHDALIEISDPCRVMAVDPDLDVLCVPIKRPTEPEEPRLEVNKDIGSAKKPVKLGERFEGYKVNNRWLYRNSDPRKPKFCTNWNIETESEENAGFDRLYVESAGDNAEVEANELF